MPIMNKHMKSGHGGDLSATPSSNLWVGNLSTDVTDADLMEIFGKHGLIDSITSYPSRSYAFLYFRRVDDATSAKNALQGFVLKGNSLKIEFAKPAKPSKHLWVGGISSSLTKERLEEEFAKFGKIEDFKFLRDRNTAFVDYVRVEDASAAVKSLNGKQIGADYIRVDFLRSHPLRREQHDSHDLRDLQFRGTVGQDPLWMQQDLLRNYSEPALAGNKRQQPSQSFGGRKEGQPSKVLWVGYPPSVHIDDQMLHNAMILFGEIEGVVNVPTRHCAFVEFRSIEEAWRAKESLQGRLFNDPRITIMFSNGELAPKDFTSPYPGLGGPVPDMFMNEVLLRPPLVDGLGHNHGRGKINFPGAPPPTSAPRPFGPRGGFDPLLPMPELSDSVMLHGVPDLNPSGPMGLHRRGPSPSAAGLLPSPVISGGPPHKTMASGWDVYDANQIPRELKRSRVDGSIINNPASAQAREDYVMGSGQPYGVQQLEGGVLGTSAKVFGNNRFSPADLTVGKGRIEARIDKECIWRGVIAKGGTPVCNARCIPIGQGIEFGLPGVVNCSARTGLDMLTKHYAEAVGFEVVFFLPDSEEDFASYTEFLRYLGLRNRAGVAKFDDGTTLFLVPPSDFLAKVLNVVGPERLYGVVLKFPQVPAGVSTQPPLQQSISSIHHMNREPAPLSNEHAIAPQKQDVLHIDYDKVNEGFLLHQKAPLPPATESHTLQSVSQNHSNPNTASVSSGVKLTPELIATLASLLPTTVYSSTMGPVTAQTADGGVSSQVWNQPQQPSEEHVKSFQQMENQASSHQQPLAISEAYQALPNASSHVLPDASQIQNPYILPQQDGISSRPPNISQEALQSENVVGAAQATQQYQLETIHGTPKGYEQAYITAATGSYGLPDTQQPKNLMSYYNQVGVDFSHPENVLPGPSGKVHSGSLNQVDLSQHAPSALGQVPTDVEVDKNQRYQSTLQFAANLLMQIQQQQSQPSSHLGQGHS
ncbi:hypothetical protein Ancab_008321 [Ancistrocladus abbreviatus]